VFDEIVRASADGVAEAVRRRFAGAFAPSTDSCVTHQPQIARFADYHFAVAKAYLKGARSLKSKNSIAREDRRVGASDRRSGRIASARKQLTGFYKPPGSEKSYVIRCSNKKKEERG